MTTAEFYAQIGGNYDEAKMRLMNDALIQRFLGKFAATYTLDALSDAAKCHDGRAIFEACHAIKGVVGNLALTKLYNLTNDLTEKTRNLEEGASFNADAELVAIQAEFDKTIALIKEFLAQQ